MAEIFQRGVDVSRYQGQIDWNKVKAAGQQYAIVRAVSTRGSAPYVDPLFEQNIRQAAAAGWSSQQRAVCPSPTGYSPGSRSRQSSMQ